MCCVFSFRVTEWTVNMPPSSPLTAGVTFHGQLGSGWIQWLSDSFSGQERKHSERMTGREQQIDHLGFRKKNSKKGRKSVSKRFSPSVWKLWLLFTRRWKSLFFFSTQAVSPHSAAQPRQRQARQQDTAIIKESWWIPIGVKGGLSSQHADVQQESVCWVQILQLGFCGLDRATMEPIAGQ